MSNLILIPENLLALSTAQANAVSEASASLTDANLLTENPSQRWRSLSNASNKVYFTLAVGASQQVPVQAKALALVGHNFCRGTQARVILDTQGPYSLEPQVMVPTGIISSSNVTTPLATQIDDGFSPGDFSPGDFMTPTGTGTDWNVRVSFNTPSSNPRTGTGRQSFWAYIRASSAPSDAAIAPTVKCELFETGGGAALANLGTKTITRATGAWYFWSFDASLLGTANGSAVECKLSCSGNTATHYDAQLDSLLWETPGSSEFPTFAVYDSGWVTYSPFSGSGITYYPEAQGGGSSWLLDFGVTKTFSRAQVLIRCDHAPTDFNYTTEIPPSQPGYIEIGCAILGETWSPSSDRNFGALVSTKDFSSKSRTYGGQRFGSRRFVQRILHLPLDWLTAAEAHTLFDRILWRQGILKPIFVSILPGDATEEKHTSFLATLRNPENVMAATTTRTKPRGLNLEFEEEL